MGLDSVAVLRGLTAAFLEDLLPEFGVIFLLLFFLSLCRALVAGELLLEVLHLLDLVRLDGRLSRLPTSRANLAVFIGMLETLDKSERLVNVTADSVIVDLHASNLMVAIENEEATDGSTNHGVLAILNEHTVVSAQIFADVSNKRIFDLSTETALVSRCLQPSKMREVRVGRDTDDLSADISELLDVLTEGNKLSGAHVREVKWIEEHHDPLALIVGQRKLRELVVFSFLVALNNSIQIREGRSLRARKRQSFGNLEGSKEAGGSESNRGESHLRVK